MKKILVLVALTIFAAGCSGVGGPGESGAGVNALTRVGNPSEDIVEPPKAVHVRYFKTNPERMRTEFKEDITDVLLVTVDDERGEIAVQSLFTERAAAPLVRDDEGRIQVSVGGYAIGEEGKTLTLAGGGVQVTAYPSSKTDAAYDSFYRTIFDDPMETAVKASDQTFILNEDLSLERDEWYGQRVRGFGMDEKTFISDFCLDPQTLGEIVRGEAKRMAVRFFECPCQKGRCVDGDIHDLGMAQASIEEICAAETFRCLPSHLLEMKVKNPAEVMGQRIEQTKDRLGTIGKKLFPVPLPPQE